MELRLREDYQSLMKYGSEWNEVSQMCTNSGQLYVAHECMVDGFSPATLKVVRTICAGHGECLNVTHGRFSCKRSCCARSRESPPPGMVQM